MNVYEFNPKVKRRSRLCWEAQNQEVSPAQLPLRSAVGLASSCLHRERESSSHSSENCAGLLPPSQHGIHLMHYLLS